MRYVSKALLVIAGVRGDGYREILGARVADCENEEFWSGMFDDTENALPFPDREISDFPCLKERGLI